MFLLPAHQAGAKHYTLEEVAQHNSEESAWFVHEGKVYDATLYLSTHPGGADSILIVAGAGQAKGGAGGMGAGQGPQGEEEHGAAEALCLGWGQV